MKRVGLITTAIAALLLGVGTAWAIPPDQDEGQIVWDDYYVGACDDGRSICEMGEYSYRSKLFYLNNGDPRKYTEKVKFLGGMYECGTEGNFLPYDPSSYTYTEDYPSGEIIIHGLFTKISMPGYGQIFKDIGNIVLDLVTGEILFEAGEHEWWNGELDLVCELLNGD